MRFAVALLLLGFPLAAQAPADQAPDVRQIRQIIARLSQAPVDPNLFGPGFQDQAELNRLFGSGPTVKISHEPWGEATISFPSERSLLVRQVRFLTPDISVVEGGLSSLDAGETPVIIVLQKHQNHWQISSIHSSGGTLPAPP